MLPHVPVPPTRCAALAIGCALVPQEDAGDGVRLTVNRLLDSLLATVTRFVELPVVAVVLGIVVLALLLYAVLAWLARRRQKPWLRTAARWLCAVLALLAIAFAIDHRVREVQRLVALQRAQSRDAVAAMLENAARPGPRRSTPLVDVAGARAALAANFPRFSCEALVCNDAIDLVRIRLEDPPVAAFLAVVDLTSPKVEIAIGATLEHKTYTSDFARARGCALAINGEAGNSPRPDCGFGPWLGHLVRDGEVLLREQVGNPRPFLAFDEHHRAHFTALAATDRSVPAGARNVVWGRVDAVVAGAIETEAFRFNQPRTAMGIDAAGDRLYLLVADGRQPDWSWGLTRPQVGQILTAFGARDAMLCDEGGSSCMFVREFGGLVNVPSDDQGRERPTYTHFGIVVRD